MNMVLHDQLVLQWLGRTVDDPQVDRLRLANAALNVVCYLAWALSAALRQPLPIGVAWPAQAPVEEPRLASWLRS